MELPFPIQEQIPAGGRPLPRVRIGRIGHHLGLGGVGYQGWMPGFLVDGEYFLVLPVILGRGLRDDEIHLQGRFPDDPALEGAVRIGLQLPGFVTERPRLPQTQGHARSLGQDTI